MKKNFYKILGVDQKASPEKIKRAFRQAAKRYHPDVSPRDEEKFREVQEAYETLSDPERKALYDQEMLTKRTPFPQPRSFRPSRSYPSSLFGGIDEFFEELEDSLMGTGYGFLDELEQGHVGFSVEITLTPSEARKGCKIPLEMPFWAECRRCRGTGYVTGLICGFCRGRGKEKIRKKITLTIRREKWYADKDSFKRPRSKRGLSCCRPQNLPVIGHSLNYRLVNIVEWMRLFYNSSPEISEIPSASSQSVRE